MCLLTRGAHRVWVQAVELLSSSMHVCVQGAGNDHLRMGHEAGTWGMRALVALTLLSTAAARADVGETFDLRHRRSQLTAIIYPMQAQGTALDSVETLRLLGLYRELADIDTRIVASMAQTIEREQMAKLHGRASLTAWAKATMALALLIAVLMALHQVSLRLAGGRAHAGLLQTYTQAARALVTGLLPDATGSGHTRISPMTVTGVVCMALSLLAVLARML